MKKATWFFLFKIFVSFILACNICSLASAAVINTAPEVNRIIVFGDSLSDTGAVAGMTYKLIPSRQNFWEGRFSDGLVWVDYLAQSYNTTVDEGRIISNQSLGGTTAYSFNVTGKDQQMKHLLKTMFNFKKYSNLDEFGNTLSAVFVENLSQRILKYEKNTRFTDRDLVIIWLGGNDLLWVASVLEPQVSQRKVAENAADYIAQGMGYLLSKGVRNILVMGLIDFDLTPLYWGKSSGQAEQITYYNQLLQQRVDYFRSFGNNIYYVDVDGFFKNTLIPYQSAFGLVDDFKKHDGQSYEKPSHDALIPALFNYQDFSVYSGGRSSHIFWDQVHPSTRSHSILAEILKQNYINRYFNFRPYYGRKCNYVEVKSKTTLELKVTYKGDHSICGTVDRKLVHNQTELFSVPDGDSLTITSIPIPHSRDVLVSNSSNIVYSETPVWLRSLMPVVQQITCTGSGILHLNCK